MPGVTCGAQQMVVAANETRPRSNKTNDPVSMATRPKDTGPPELEVVWSTDTGRLLRRAAGTAFGLARRAGSGRTGATSRCAGTAGGSRAGTALRLAGGAAGLRTGGTAGEGWRGSRDHQTAADHHQGEGFLGLGVHSWNSSGGVAGRAGMGCTLNAALPACASLHMHRSSTSLTQI